MNINYDKIFSIFEENDQKENSTSYEDFRNHPIFYLGMYKKLINYKPISQDKITKYLKSQYLNLNPEDIARAGIFISYNKAWDYIGKFNILNDFHIEQLIRYSDKDLLDSLLKGIKYWESTTEYEKCAFLKKIYDSIPKEKNK